MFYRVAQHDAGRHADVGLQLFLLGNGLNQQVYGRFGNVGDGLLDNRDILAQDTDDALVFDLDSIKAEDITEFKEYHGLHISAVAYLDRTRIPIGIDIGFGDVIYPNAVEMEFPVILDMEAPRVAAYSLESSIAEKLEAIVKNGFLNSRYKDFYDIYVLSEKYPFNYEKLQNAVTETFTNRKTLMTMDTAAFSDEFLGDTMHQTRSQIVLTIVFGTASAEMKSTRRYWRVQSFTIAPFSLSVVFT